MLSHCSKMLQCDFFLYRYVNVDVGISCHDEEDLLIEINYDK